MTLEAIKSRARFIALCNWEGHMANPKRRIKSTRECIIQAVAELEAEDAARERFYARATKWDQMNRLAREGI